MLLSYALRGKKQSQSIVYAFRAQVNNQLSLANFIWSAIYLRCRLSLRGSVRCTA